jgi:hypothetical protein
MDKLLADIFDIIENRGNVDRTRINRWIDSSTDNEPETLYENILAPIVNQIEDKILNYNVAYASIVKNVDELMNFPGQATLGNAIMTDAKRLFEITTATGAGDGRVVAQERLEKLDDSLRWIVAGMRADTGMSR